MKQTFYNFCPLCDKMILSFKQEMQRRNFYDERLLLNWRYIFNDFADKIAPLKIIFNGIDNNGVVKKILYVATFDRRIATEFLFYKQRLLDDLNTYFGIDKSIYVDLKIKLINQ